MKGLSEKNYSNAIYELSQEENCVQSTYDELSYLADVMNENPDFVKVLSLPTISMSEKNGIISDVFNGKLSELVFNFLKVLTKNSKIILIPKIFCEYKNRFYEQQGILEITATTTEPLESEQRQRLIARLERISDKRVILIEKLDLSIIGGIVLSYGNTKLDSSIKTRIDSMRKQINSIIA